jgi:hypothetical protein
MIYTDLQTEKMLVILDQVSAQTNSAQQTIEKDWWVTPKAPFFGDTGQCA